MDSPVLIVNKGFTNDVQFEISVSGDMPLSAVRLVLGAGEYSLVYPGEYKDGVAHFEVFAGDNIDDVKDFDLEVLSKDRYFVPLSGSVKIEKPISASIKDNKRGGGGGRSVITATIKSDARPIEEERRYEEEEEDGVITERGSFINID